MESPYYENDNTVNEYGPEDKIDYKKAFDLLMVMMIAKTLSPDEHNFGYGGGVDTCLRCMEQGHNFAYGDDGDKKLVCDKCPNNLTAARRTICRNL